MSARYPPFGPLVCVVGFHHHRGPEIESWFGVPPDVDPAVDNDWSYLPFMALADGAHASTEDFSYFTLRRKLPADPATTAPEASAEVFADTAPVTTVETPQNATAPEDAQPAGEEATPEVEVNAPPSPPANPGGSPKIVAPKPINPSTGAAGMLARPSAKAGGETPSLSRAASPLPPSRPRYGVGASVFAMSCTRQLSAAELLRRPDDVTRSTVQKSVVLLVGSRPGRFAGWREKLGAVTRAWFMQRDFEDREILKESLLESEKNNEDEPDHFLGISLRQFIYEFRHQALFALISLIPGLIRHLEDCADPSLDSYAENAFTPTSLRTSDRNSLLEYMGLPLQIFGKGGFFGPYTPLQQLDLLSDFATRSYIVGSTNTLLLQHKDGGPEVVVDVDEKSIMVYNQALKTILALSPADRRWIDSIHETIVKTWDPQNPSQPIDHGYLGSEDFIRFQFEEYVLALLSATKYEQHFCAIPPKKRDLSAFPEIDGDPTADFGEAWIDVWKMTPNYALWNKYTDTHLFDIVEPRHPTAGGLSVDDIQRRFAQQIQDLHLDSRVAAGREALGKHLASGQKKVSSAFSSLWTEIEARRAASKGPETRSHSPSSTQNTLTRHASVGSHAGASPYMEVAAARASQAGAVAAAAGQRASAYLSGWGAWASEKRRGWGRSSSTLDLKESAREQDEKPRQSFSSTSTRLLAAAAGNVAATGGGAGFGRNERGLTVSTHEPADYAVARTPEGAHTLWESSLGGGPPNGGGGGGPGNDGGADSPRSPRSPVSLASVTGSLKSPRRLKRMSVRGSGKGEKSKERVVDGIGRIDA